MSRSGDAIKQEFVQEERPIYNDIHIQLIFDLIQFNLYLVNICFNICINI